MIVIDDHTTHIIPVVVKIYIVVKIPQKLVMYNLSN